MSNTQKKNLLALSVAALVASSVAAVAGVTTFERDLTGKSVYLGYEDSGHPYNSSGYSGGSAYYPSTGTASAGTAGASTATGSPAPACPTADLKSCQATCVKDGVTNSFCDSWCKQACPASTSTTTSTTTTITNRCADITEGEGCMQKCLCYADRAGSCASPRSGEADFCNAVKSADAAKTGKTGVFNMTTCSNYCDSQKEVPPPAPVASTPAPVVDAPAADASTATKETPVIEDSDFPSLEEDDVRHEAAFEDDDFESKRDVSGKYDDFGGYDDFRSGPDFGGEFDMGFGGDDPFRQAMMAQYGDEFSLEEDDFSGYFGDFGPGMDGGDFGGGFGGDGFGGMPYMDDMGEEILEMAGGFCPHEVLDDIQQAMEDGEFEEIEQLMMEGCMGGGGFGGPMEDPSEIVETLWAMTEGIDLGLVVLEENGFDKDVASDIRGLLTQVNAAADEAEEACADLGFGEEEEDEDFFGLKGFLAQIFDDEEEDDDFFGDDEEGGACREAIEKAFYLMDPDSDEDYPNSVRGIMQPAIEDFFRNLHEEDEATSREVFAAFIKKIQVVVVGDEIELSDENINRMYDILVESDFDFDMVASPSTDHGEWEADDRGSGFGGDVGEFDEEEDEGGKAGGGGFTEEEEFNEEDFDF